MIDPDDQVPQYAPVVQRDEDLREVQVFDVRFGSRAVSFTSKMIVRRHPGTDETTVALTPREKKRNK